MEIKVIKTKAEYEAALAEIEQLIDKDAKASTPEGERLELLAVLVREYESKTFPKMPVDPIEAIEFRMEQQNLAPRDLVPYIGSRSKVSEVLARKRPLSLSMIRSLHEGLGIPAPVLLQERNLSYLEDTDIEWSRFPIREMISRGWVSPSSDPEDLLRGFFAPVGIPQLKAILLKKTDYVRSARPMDLYALAAWAARIMIRAKQSRPSRYVSGTVTFEFMRQLAHLSPSDKGPLLAQEFLHQNGISLVIEPHLSRTYLDGAALLLEEAGRPIIGLTLRHDRLDNFWFCLMHELVHVSRHIDRDTHRFFDDLDIGPQEDDREREADHIAGEALIPEEEWRSSPASRLRTPDAVMDSAKKLGIHPAIVAGRIRHQYKSFRVLKDWVGYGQVRRYFPEIDWKD